MKQILIGRMADASTKDEFCFSLRCEECTKVWRSAPVPLSKAGVSPSTEGKRKSRKGRRRSFQYLPHLPAPHMQRMLSDLR